MRSQFHLYYEKAKVLIKKYYELALAYYQKVKASSIPLYVSAPRPIAHWMLWTTLIFIIIFLIWAKFAVLEEVTVAQATVIPLSHVQTIENMEGGILKKILVHEGDIVQKGQVLMYLDPTRFLSALHEAQAHILSLKMKINRLSAVVDSKIFTVDPTLLKQFPSETSNEYQLYLSQEDQIKQIKESYVLAKKEYDMTKPLVKDGAASEVDVLHLQRQVVDLQNQIDDFYSHARSELESAKADLATASASLLAIQDRVDRTTIRSPVRGIIKQIKLDTASGVTLPGSEIMSIVPLDDTLLVEAQVKPSDIGFIHTGESATVKITAYDYSIYGGLTGTVQDISADTITTQKGESYYLVRIKTQKNYLRTKDNPLYIIPGMTATVHILTGNKSVLDYLLSPILKAKENALRER